MINKQQTIIAAGIIAISCCLFNTACQPVKEYQKNKLNDSEMSTSNRKVEKTELSFQSYREAASGANAGKSGGGCGCN